MDNKPQPFFKVKKITSFDELNADSVLSTSDLLLSDDKKVVQFEYVNPNADEDSRTIIEKGIYALIPDKYGDIQHKSITFNADKIIQQYAHTERIITLADKFFSKLDIYKKRDLFPKRAMLLYGKAGQGKTSSVIAAVNKYVAENTVALVWPSAVIRAHHVKQFLKGINFKNVDRIILIVEDIGGGELQYTGQKLPVDAELLALLDNSTNTFEIPTLILATTNYPANLIEPLLRTGRFDDLIEVKPPTGEQRSELLRFFAGDLTDDAGVLELIKGSKYDKLSISDLKELPLKAELEDISLKEALDNLMSRLLKIENEFEEERKSMVFGNG